MFLFGSISEGHTITKSAAAASSHHVGGVLWHLEVVIALAILFKVIKDLLSLSLSVILEHASILVTFLALEFNHHLTLGFWGFGFDNIMVVATKQS